MFVLKIFTNVMQQKSDGLCKLKVDIIEITMMTNRNSNPFPLEHGLQDLQSIMYCVLHYIVIYTGQGAMTMTIRVPGVLWVRSLTPLMPQ